MQRQHFEWNSPNGAIAGIYADAGPQTPLVIIANGHNGFYNYGMFPYIQQSLHGAGISSIAFNYSHSGIVGETDVFEDLERYGKNCRRLEKEDLLFALRQTRTAPFEKHSGTFILAHSMGGIATVFAAREAMEAAIPLSGLILLCSLSTLNVRPQAIMEEWQRNGVYYIRNNRTLQDLPQGTEYLHETLASEGAWNLEPIVRSLQLPILVAHSGLDESVPLKHGEALYSWAKDNHSATELFMVPNGSHTLNTKHPFAGTTEQLEAFLAHTLKWIRSLEKGRS
jgi:pimeloyl-ACP methyl ester carboxylesterase